LYGQVTHVGKKVLRLDEQKSGGRSAGQFNESSSGYFASGQPATGGERFLDIFAFHFDFPDHLFFDDPAAIEKAEGIAADDRQP
jgi:hypothetical protein